jgi:hypothetical protein
MNRWKTFAVLLAFLVPAAGLAAEPAAASGGVKSMTVVSDFGKPFGEVTVRVGFAPDEGGTQLMSVELAMADGVRMSVPAGALKWCPRGLESVSAAREGGQWVVTLRDRGAEWLTVNRQMEIQSYFAYREVAFVFAEGKFVKRTDETVIVRPLYPSRTGGSEWNSSWLQAGK